MASIDTTRTALVLMDFVNDVVDPKGKFAAMGIGPQLEEKRTLENAARALQAARDKGLPVIHVRVHWREGHPDLNPNVPFFQGAIQGQALIEGTWASEFHPSVAPRAGEPVISKRGVSAFNGTELARYLALKGIQTLVLAGVATNWVVEGTTRDAADLGYNVIILKDCCASFSDALHTWSLENVLSLLGQVTTVDEFAASLGN